MATPPVRRRAPPLFRQTGKPTVRTWIVASAIVFAPAAVADLIAGVGRPPALTVAWAFGLGLAVAALNGLLWHVAFGIGRRLPPSMPWLVWPSATLGVGAYLANELGAFTRLGGKDQKLALLALAGCFAGGLAAGFLAALLQPRRTAPRGMLVHRRPWVRGIFVVLLLGGAAAAAFVDREYFPGTYPYAHWVLRVGSLWLAMFGITTTGIRIGPAPDRRRRTIGLFAYAAAALFPFVTLGEDDTAAIHDLVEQPITGAMLRSAREVTDFDRDGFSSFLGGGDCAPLNPWVSPGAPEIPGNGVDDNCRLGDAKPPPPIPDQTNVPIPPQPSPLSVLLVTIDTLRADHLSLYGYGRDTTPNLTRFARSAMKFDCAITSGGWTSVAVSSLMRGVYPRRLLWTPLVETTKYRLVRYPLEQDLEDGEHIRLGFVLPLEDPRMTLAGWLKRRGMYTAAVTDDGYSDFLSAEYTSTGFDRYVEVNPHGNGAHKGDEDTAELAMKVIREAPTDKPLFLWVHFFGPHEPNTSHPGLPNWGKKEADGYDQEIRFADMQVQKLVDAWDKAARPSAVVITSDHGEVIRNDHDRDHGSELKPEILWVPLLLRAPGIPSGNVNLGVSLVDLMPTILGLTSTPAPAGLDGIDLRRAIARAPESRGRYLLTDTWRMNLKLKFEPDISAVSDGKWTFVIDLNDRDIAVRPVCDRSMSRTNLYGWVNSKPLSDVLYRYEEDTGGEPRIRIRPKPPSTLDPFWDPSMW